MSIYVMPGISACGGLMASLGKFRTGFSCLYITRLSTVDIDVLSGLLVPSVRDMRAKQGVSSG